MNKTRLLIDAHAHIHRCFSFEQTIVHANANFELSAKDLNIGENWTGCLICSDLHGNRPENTCRELVSKFSSNYEIRITDEKLSCVLTSKISEKPFLLIFGNQIVTKENIEVLVYGLCEPVVNGLSIKETIDRAVDQDGLVILPWGFGKWWHSRGKIVENMIQTWSHLGGENHLVYVGDSGARLKYFSSPRQIKFAAKLGLWNLPGSDPLPFLSQEKKPGCTGFILDELNSLKNPLQSIKHQLRSLDSQPTVFGEGETLRSFCKFQLEMQYRKHISHETPITQ